ncbi:SirB2 family protein [Kinneretia aquatilis]|uniref:SirB2 family protein n=1 Tax=Kinneretia aquatilis TaxID=2070761 RepID=UPI0014951971|nr:SirB2 family protein [Paucibacter aquatile]WIV96982.1 SirB2 family protein [Paucibacter aquatile]
MSFLEHLSALLQPLQSHYPVIKLAHISLVACSAVLFTARGLAVLAGAAWPMQKVARRLSVLIDVALLAAGLSLWTLLGLNPGRDLWLASKLSLLLLYIVLGSIALKRGRSRGQRAAGLLAALLVLGLMVTVARTHHPLGLFH